MNDGFVLIYLFTLQPDFLYKMQVIKEIKELRSILDEKRGKGLRIGFVPTMGALHAGHLSLVTEAGNQSDVVVVSIFVNPTQFNDKADLERYPRTLEADVLLLKQTPCEFVFVPEVDEIYPEPDTRNFNFGSLEQVMEGQFRPGHFNGVAQVVSRLFDIVKPDKAFFGMKDFQQVAIIKAMVKMLGIPVEIVPCPIVRENDGLAMSSRNMLLDPQQRANAPHIAATLFEAVTKAGQLSVEELKKWVVDRVNENPYLNTEYFEIVDDETLQPVSSWEQRGAKVGCIAVHCGKIRLIDNVVFNR